jgi:hypothetical protein
MFKQPLVVDTIKYCVASKHVFLYFVDTVLPAAGFSRVFHRAAKVSFVLLFRRPTTVSRVLRDGRVGVRVVFALVRRVTCIFIVIEIL